MFGIGSIVNSAFGVILVPIYIRHLRAGEFGILSLLTVTMSLVVIVLKFGLNHAFFRHYYETEDRAHRRKIVGSTLLFLVLSSTLFTLLLYSVAPQASAAVFGGDRAKAGLMRLVFFISFFEIITLVPDSILRASFKSARYSVLNIVAFVFQLSIITYLVIFVDSNVENVLIGRLAGVIFEAVLFFWAVRRELSASFSLSELKEMLGFGFPLIFGQISFTLFMMIDRFFLERYTNNAEVGVYAMSNTLVNVVAILVTVPFSQVWTVMRFSVMKEEGAEEYYSRILTYIVFVSMFLALGVAAVAGDGLLLFGLKSYYPAAMIIPLLALSAVLDSAARVLNIGITLRKRTIYAPLVILAALAVNVALNFLLVPKYGSLGATIATLLSYVVFCGLRFWASNMFFKVRYEWGRVFTLAALGSVMIGAFYLITFYYFPDYVRDPGVFPKMIVYASMSIKALLALSFPLMLFALRFYDERELRRLVDLWKRVGLPNKEQLEGN
ncbi:MAG TPA: oligosaccharide flippase family protein [Blastocatellia bacterium]|nr:oligosaccharide flippase family protein [Blastocatellia bacterium]